MSELTQFLFGLRARGVRPGLESTHAVLEALGRPDRRYPVLQVAGTVGKGSTSAFAESVLRAHGLKVGRFVSPHLVRFTERFLVDGAEAAEADVARALDDVRARVPWAADPEAPRPSPDLRPLTFFEWCVVLACVLFADAGVDVAVLEVGLGGRWDATTAAGAETVAVSRIALDHQAVLGPDEAAIAGEKAGAFRPGVPAVIARQSREAGAVLTERAASLGCPLTAAGADYQWAWSGGALDYRSPGVTIEAAPLGLAGAHQGENAALAVAAVEALLGRMGRPIDGGAVRTGLAAVQWPGRLERLAPDLWVDGAHNEAGAWALAQAIPDLMGPSVHLVFAVLQGREPEPLLEALLPRAASVTLTRVGGDRAIDPEGYRAFVEAAHGDVRVEPDPARALAAARARAAGDGRVVLATGSLYLVGAAKALASGDAVDPGDPPAVPTPW